MTSDELKAWRIAKGLSQQESADLLGASSRFVIMRWESGADIPTSIAARIQEAEAAIAAAPPGSTPAPAKTKIKGGLPSQVILSPGGHRVREDYPHSLQIGQVYWKYDWIDKTTGHHIFNLYQIGADADGTIRGLCTPVRMDVNTWEVRCDFHLGGDAGAALLRTVAKLDERLAPARVNPPQSLAETIAPNPKKNEAPFAQAAGESTPETKTNFFL